MLGFIEIVSLTHGLENLLDLLRNHESLSQEDFQQELQKQRGLAAVAVS